MRSLVSFRTALSTGAIAASLSSAALAQPTVPPAPAAQAPLLDNEPIIPDEEFDASIPPIDDNPDAPMGSVADWEAEQKRLEEQSRRQDAQSGAATTPATRDGTATELLADPPVNDPEIDAPLTPLGAFDVEPFDDSRFTEGDDSSAAEARYTYRVDGLDGISEKGGVAPITGGDVLAMFKELSALHDGKGRAANGAMINARMAEDQQLLTDILSGQGFFDARVQGSLQLPEQNSSDPITVILQVTPGPRYALGTIDFTAPAVTPPDLITGAFVPKTGEPIVAERIQAAEANIAVVLPENGYPFTKIGQRDILLDEAARTGDYTLPIETGPRSSFGDMIAGGAKPVFEPDHITRLARFKKGDLYDSRKVDDLRQALVATGLLSVVSIEPEATGTPAAEGSEYANLLVRQEAGPPRTIGAQAGYGTGQGIKVEGGWTHRNLFPPEGALIATVIAGTQEQGLGATFRRSNAGRRDRTVELSLNALHSDFDAYEAFTGRLAGRISYDSTPIWQKRFTYSYGFELLGTNEQDYDFAAGERRRRTYYVLALPGQATWDTSDSLLDPTRGFRLSAKISPEGSLGSGGQIYGRGLFEATGYYPVAENIVLAGRARVGTIMGAERAQIAPSRRFYGGGGGSVRGFGYQELGPKDPEARPIGGRSLVETAAEVRYRFGNYGVVGFIDGGQVYTDSMPQFSDWRFGVGIGGRFYTNFGPMRLDIATPINRKPGESRVSVYISIGQAF
ncbi:autotransporter assembly complex protein TamA [Sphingomonas sp. C3-2]|uniref:autotransporter assembly complex protein TamA n=1 Tax=Sphingomonas sp. C3-2 TaxID=3062169 RepID=UPI00294AB342|nr:BamA/TamA family outer membrane protein [Sphingomonas sp. C3-2]WOK37500.1 BamA/TamA family outer membrane protein [Sphingomonas sp. C3-2]